jgi:hypothetical protein
LVERSKRESKPIPAHIYERTIGLRSLVVLREGASFLAILSGVFSYFPQAFESVNEDKEA